MRLNRLTNPWLVPPLLLTIVLLSAAALGAPPLVLAGLVVAQGLAWLAFAWGGASTPGDAAVQELQLMAELRTYVGREIEGTRTEVERTRTLVRAAVGELNRSFTDLAGESRVQAAAVTDVVGQERAAAADSPGVRAFAAASGRLMDELAGALSDNSRQSVVTVGKIDEMAAHLDAIFELLGTPVASADGAAHQRVSSARQVVGDVRAMMEQVASHGMDASVEAKVKADELRGEVERVNRSLADAVRAMSVSGRRIHDSVGTAVQSLQFEDIVTQALGAAETHLDRLQAINQEALRLQALLADASTRPDARIGAMEEFLRHMKAAREKWATPARTPVVQTDLKTGSVDLF